MRTILGRAGLIAGAIFLSDACAQAQEWTYEGEEGPEHWGELSEDFAACGAGMMQSPIDLAGVNARGDVMLAMAYGEIGARLPENHHTVQVAVDEGLTVSSAGETFRLLQFHFHTPSEHVFGGASYPMVAHFVHQGEDGQLLVVGVMFEEGEASEQLAAILEAHEDGAEALSVDAAALAPAGAMYRYMGSLTTPPCSEGVHWHVLAEPQSASAAQIAAFEAIMGENARPVQAQNNRLLLGPPD